VISDCTEAGRQARLAMDADLKGGFYSNRDSAYIYAHLSRLFGPVVVVNGTVPRVPRTYTEPARMPKAELRYWSLCSGESRVTTRTADCLADRQVALRGDRAYTIVVSKPEDRPANALRRCGVSWLDMGRGDGDQRSDYAAIIMRNMLVSKDFAQAIQRVPDPRSAREVMGPYFPDAAYMAKATFEAKGCPAV
jgi:hypothetical protein